MHYIIYKIVTMSDDGDTIYEYKDKDEAIKQRDRWDRFVPTTMDEIVVSEAEYAKHVDGIQS